MRLRRRGDNAAGSQPSDELAHLEPAHVADYRYVMPRLGIVETTNIMSIDVAHDDRAPAAMPSPRARRA